MSQKKTLFFCFQHTILHQNVDGIKIVTAWTTKRDLDVFTKKMLFLPIHQDFHWSLCIICNAGNVSSSGCVEEENVLKCLSYCF